MSGAELFSGCLMVGDIPTAIGKLQHIRSEAKSFSLSRKENMEQYKSLAKDRDDDETEIQQFCRTNMIDYVSEDTAVIRIEGVIVPNYAWYHAFLGGIVSCEAIIESASMLESDSDIKKVVIKINSNGGYSDGVGVAYDALKRLSAKKKGATISYTDSNMKSAGYWLGCGSPVILAGEWAMVGSVGAYTVVQSQYELLTQLGIESYISRSADKKGRPSGYEPIKDLDKSVVDRHNKIQFGFFNKAVSRSRSNLKEGYDSGESFAPPEARKLGLIDGVISFDRLLKRL